jgi:2-polyprenyl-6-methoxyphenol hydroxylase-like FAD-dependent oxidoreductase
MEIIIFGAGVAGLMSAITLRAQGHHCRIFERNRQAHEAGMGFILMPEGIDCLQSFGVSLAGANGGVPLQQYCCRNAAGEILHEQAMPAGARSFRRRDLISALTGAPPVHDALIFDCELDALEFDASGRVRRARVNSPEGVLLVEADLYVAADGIGSRARSALFPGWPAPLAQVPEVVGLVRCQETVRWAGNNFHKFHSPSGGIAVGVVPVDHEHLVWFLQFDAQQFPPPQESAEACHSFVTRLVGQWAHPIPHLLAQTDFSRAHVWLPVDADLIPRFHQGNLVLVGDAAHPVIPLTSQGLSSALSDAVALARLLTANSNDLARALPLYSEERRRQCAPYIAKGRELTEYFLGPQIASNVLLPMA